MEGQTTGRYITREGKPFLRWAGGKQALANSILAALPSNLWQRFDRWIEPFLGAGSIYFAIRPPKAILGDENGQLISCFHWIKRSPSLVWDHLKDFADRHSRAEYYKIREYYNRATDSARKAAAFIYLNSACFNGVFRVNRLGHFNVPVGRRERLVLPAREHLCHCSASLKTAHLKVADYSVLLDTASVRDLVFLDPPYPALSETAFFNHYTAERFGEIDQERLAYDIDELDKRGVKFFLTIAATPTVKRRYRRYWQKGVIVTRYVSGNDQTHKLTELFISNLWRR